MQLTDHFADTELGVSGCVPQIVANATQLCTILLEPIRAQFGPVAISDGYRDPAHNAAVGGVSGHSQHLYLDQNSAADIAGLADSTLENAFDWIRLESHLPFDQVILEVNPTSKLPSCIHISYNGALSKQRREALTGETNGAGAYQVVAVNP
jgi:zinc D-Ala-D-Ala carboxypeptidase